MLYLFKSAASRAVTFGLIGVLAVGALVGGLRLVLPFADLFRSELEGALSAALGLQVRIGHFGLGLAGLEPRLTIENAELLDPDSGRPLFSLKELQVALNPTASLQELAPEIDSITLVGAELVLQRLRDGKIALSGLEGLKAGYPGARTFFLGNGRFQLEDSDLYWVDEKIGAPALHLTDVRVVFDNSEHEHRLAVLARLFGDRSTELRLVGDLVGAPDGPATWGGDFYLHLRGGGFGTILDGRLPPGLHLGSDSVDLESWTHLEGGRAVQSLNRVAAKGMNIRGAAGDGGIAPMRFDRLEGLLQWRRLGEDRGDSCRFLIGDMALDLPRLFPNPIELDEAAGEIRWHRDDQGRLEVWTDGATVANADVATRSRFSIRLPGNGSSPFLDLQTDFRDVQATSVRRYIPSRRLREKLAAWLDRAFVAGTVPSGTLLFHGTIADFPFDEGQGRFEVRFDVEDATLDYHREWPPIEKIDAAVRFENRKMEIFASTGRFLDSALSDVRVGMPDLGKADALKVRGKAEGPFADDLRVLRETPLRKKLGGLARLFVAKGISDLDLDMSIPLHHEGQEIPSRVAPLRLAGKLGWPGPASLAIPDQDVELTGLGGQLRFTEDGLAADSIEAGLWDVPVRLRLDTGKPRNGAGRSTRILADGTFPVPVLARQFPSSSWKTLKGRARLELRLDIGGADMGTAVPPIDFELTSDLNGLAVELPSPLGKTENGNRQLKLSGRLAAKEVPDVQGSYGDLGLHLGLKRDGHELRLARGAFDLGGASPPLPKGEGLYLQGSVAALDLQDWLDWWEKEKSSAESDSGKGITLRSADLQIERLRLSDTALDDVHLDLDNRGDRWEASIRARDLDGEIRIPSRPRRAPIEAVLERLDLKGLLEAQGGKDSAPTHPHESDPRRADVLDLKVERLLWGKNLLGSLAIRSQAVPNGLDFTELALEGPVMSIQGRGSWLQTGAGSRSELALTAKGSDLGEFLRSLEYKSLIYMAPADIALDLAWPGGPTDPSLAELSGRIGLEVGAGSLLEVEPGVGRVLGILNLEALRRRLTLDFSDLYGRGFAFEKITGELEIRKGKAVIEKLDIDGPSSDIKITGSTDLADGELDQVVIVTPRLGTGVAIAGAVAGGPLVGAAVLLADRVSGGGVDKLGRHQYLVTGPWAEPRIRSTGWSADRQAASASGHFLNDAGHTGPKAPSEPEPGHSEVSQSTEKRAEGRRSEPPAAGDSTSPNLFLESY
jgi:uncharacterized protein (TIGR02099 family)